MPTKKPAARPAKAKVAPKAKTKKVKACCDDSCCSDKSCNCSDECSCGCSDSSCCCGKKCSCKILVAIIVIVIAAISYFAYTQYEKSKLPFEVSEENGITTVNPGEGLVPTEPPNIAPPTTPPPAN